MIKAVTFDLDGVYFSDDSFKKFKQNYPKTTIGQDLIDHVLAKSEEMMKFKRGDISEAEYWSYVNRNFKSNISIDEITTLISEAYSVNQNVVDTVIKVRNLGLKTCICTNNFPTRINALNHKFSFLANFDVQVFSYKVRSIKPEPQIFSELISQSQCEPNEIIFADDKQANVDSALALGINAFVYTGFDNFLAKLHESGLML